jgi:hypothetical protein
MKPWVVEKIIFKHEGASLKETIVVSAFLKETHERVGWLVIPADDQGVLKSSEGLLAIDRTK